MPITTGKALQCELAGFVLRLSDFYFYPNDDLFIRGIFDRSILGCLGDLSFDKIPVIFKILSIPEFEDKKILCEITSIYPLDAFNYQIDMIYGEKMYNDILNRIGHQLVGIASCNIKAIQTKKYKFP